MINSPTSTEDQALLSNTGLLALRAVVVIAQWHDGRPASANEIAARLEAPRNYLSKVLHRLARQGILRSIRGPGGGYVLEQAPEDLTVSDVVSEFERPSRPDLCLLGGPCDHDDPCAAHATWRDLKERSATLLHDTTVADFLSEVSAIEHQPGAMQ